MRLYRVRRYLERTGGEQTRTARAYYQRHQRARRSVMAEAVVFKVCLKKMKKEKKKSSGCSFWVQCVPHWQLVYVCVCVGVTPACTVACLHVLILWCLLTEWRGGDTKPPGIPSTGLVNYCHSAITSPPQMQNRDRQPQQLDPKGPSLHQCLTSATASLCLTCFPLLVLSPPPPPRHPLLHQSISGYFVSQLYRELLLMTTITVVYFLSAAQPLYACRASITLWYSSALY